MTEWFDDELVLIVSLAMGSMPADAADMLYGARVASNNAAEGASASV